MKCLASFVVAVGVVMLSALPARAACVHTVGSAAAKSFANTGSPVGTVNQVSFGFRDPAFGAGCAGVSFTLSGPDWVVFDAASLTFSSTRTVYFQVLPNTGAARSGVITATYSNGGTKTVAVSQAGDYPTVCTVSVSPTAKTVTGLSTVFAVSVTTQAGCVWGASVSHPQLSLSAASGTGSGAFTVTVSGPRAAGKVWVNDQTITITR